MINKAVIFDMDGVIFDSERLVLECWKKVGEKYHLADIRKVFIECIGTNKERTKEIVYEYYGESFAGTGIFQAGKVNGWKYIIYRLFMMKKQKF